MSILGKIFGRIFPHASAAQASAATASAPQASNANVPAQPQGRPAPAAAAATAERVDIQKVLDGMATNHPQKLNWRTSIVDLMKLVGMDSTLQERKDLADELGYTGDKSDSAKMNIWLHKEVLRRMEQNGGKVPASLMD